MALLRDTLGRTLFADRYIETRADLLRVAIRKGVQLQRADLSGCDLAGMDLSKVDFSEANFDGADLGNADLTACTFKGATFNRADLRGADFSRTDVRGASFTGANIDPETRFKDILYWGSEFEGSDFIKGEEQSG